jgi:hypothetical protein
VIIFVLAAGELQLLDAEGRVIGTENWRTVVERYLDHCRANDIEPHDLTFQAPRERHRDSRQVR